MTLVFCGFGNVERAISDHERPHEGINNAVPASLYLRSSVPLPRTLKEFTYPRGFQTRCVNSSGDITWYKDRVFISQVFSFEDLGFEEIDRRLWRNKELSMQKVKAAAIFSREADLESVMLHGGQGSGQS